MFPKTSKPDYIRLNLDDLSEIQCETMFSFQKHDMQSPLTALEISLHLRSANKRN
ncbi:unnamed protein product [Pocillopora meandrina]|uniref:Uncharacterized protein n=1 Tax=Pocillopora meandrina TaxID=46732 RepID=A0AAU9WBU6_9CNID|nr:unnamed protein product [Pocillopora meandrina]